MTMPPEERLGSHLKRAEQELMAAKTAAVRPAGLTVPQYAALLALSGSPGISSAGLARACLVTPQAMTVLLRNLEEAGLVERSPHPWHKGLLEIHLTESGRGALARADGRAVLVERALAEEFSPEERDRLVDMLGRCARVLSTLR
ncbi:MarR family winged helix-turn-helix transcriptional regulator [Streptacidiphilus griseoplanus]|uniref:MarR family winged helix-turn-helix transcriptional regulator n=1 Tax=Peterkaempfera griseoplana TaxID=66896 RepID=UPI000AAC47AE|nr:MarR family transcriptional regulator [Peterkaempfera griseoplana]